MTDQTVPIEINDNGDESHPSFGCVSVSRLSGSSRPLFQSDILHRESIRLSVSTATRNRDLHSDWLHSGHRLVEIEMSLAQWGELVSSIGSTETPVTLRYADIDGDGKGEHLPRTPYDSRTAKNVEEMRAAFTRNMTNITEAMDKLNELEEAKAGIKERRAARNALTHLINNVPNNMAFATDMLAEQAENMVSRAKADIEAAVLLAAGRYNVAIDALPADHQIGQGEDLIAGEIENREEDDS